MDTPEFIINTATGKKILKWCSSGAVESIDSIKKEIDVCKTVEELRHLYLKYPNLKALILDDIMIRKEQIENVVPEIVSEVEIIKQQKPISNGIDTSKQ